MIGSLILAATLGSTTPIYLNGTVGLCIRWDGPEHIGDAVVVASSGNPALDEPVPAMIKALRWQCPDPYDRGWVGIVYAAQGKPSEMARPDCSRYPLPKRSGK